MHREGRHSDAGDNQVTITLSMPSTYTTLDLSHDSCALGTQKHKWNDGKGCERVERVKEGGGEGGRVGGERGRVGGERGRELTDLSMIASTSSIRSKKISLLVYFTADLLQGTLDSWPVGSVELTLRGQMLIQMGKG